VIEYEVECIREHRDWHHFPFSFVTNPLSEDIRYSLKQTIKSQLNASAHGFSSWEGWRNGLW